MWSYLLVIVYWNRYGYLIINFVDIITMINLIIYYHILYPIINIDKINITSMQIIIFMLVVM